jgi:hypothetical protein
VRAALARPGTIAGAFSFRVDAPHRGLRVIERLVAFRSRVLGMPYGDQGIFLRRDVFRRAGGFPDVPFMEDFDLMRRLRALGTVRTVRPAALTSPRRWLALGVLRMTAINQVVIAGRLAGAAPDRLGRWYASRRPRASR